MRLLFEGSLYKIYHTKGIYKAFINGKPYASLQLSELSNDELNAYAAVKASLHNKVALYNRLTYLACNDFCNQWFSRPKDAHVCVSHLDRGVYWILDKKKTPDGLVHLVQLQLKDGNIMIGNRTIKDGDPKFKTDTILHKSGITLDQLKQHIKYGNFIK